MKSACHRFCDRGRAQPFASLINFRGAEIVIAGLPERAALRATQALGYVLLQHLQCDGKFGSLRLGQEQMNVLRHDHISGDVEAVPLACIFEGLLEYVAGVRGGQSGRVGVATEGDEMEPACFLVSL